MRSLGGGLVALLLTACTCGAPEDTTPSTFVATEADFVDFDRWERFERSDQSFLPSHLGGETYVYLNRRPPEGAERYPVGTIVIRVTQAGPASDWEVHAMALRGDGYNAEGAVGWEYFDLEIERTGEQLTPRIHWRGEGPGDEGDGYAHGAEGVQLGCNHCHGAVPELHGLLGEELRL